MIIPVQITDTQSLAAKKTAAPSVLPDHRDQEDPLVRAALRVLLVQTGSQGHAVRVDFRELQARSVPLALRGLQVRSVLYVLRVLQVRSVLLALRVLQVRSAL